MFPMTTLYKALGAVAVVGVIFFVGYRAGHNSVMSEWNADKAAQAQVIADLQQKARNVEQQQAAAVQKIKDTYDAKQKSTNAQLADALKRLRERTDATSGTNMSNATSGAGGNNAASTGELSATSPIIVGVDAEQLLRLGADADNVVHTLTTCQGILGAERPAK